ncbi:bifunctional hydroxymethylpyrimidine kinase/phosphomethylpyrimidine kinase [Crenobacter cavernae]|uniref:hydroxymethylpyrimidine kinase n=1 Tax=Crenobacter cavernae TaxID=2290923 RepID=A0A345Y4U6_9NEIS|nr:bifunctional hydroxymethylpyrimidine kinase/phosphomethylpyrimidine kinase [Crenobacter cavernae]AXK38948.1 bifunctional hydroxymethylpyrimidine kinase/phosphomethylpyrimidine kinase [Crenobacter cavernae]
MSTPPVTPPIVMTLAGSDPTGGAGLQADILTLASLGCHPLSVVTAVTVQDTAGVTDFLVMDAEWLVDQARALLEDMKVSAFKLGMIGSVENVAAIAEVVSDYPEVPLIVDPVLASGGGHAFADEDLIAAIRDMILPQTTIVTPNSIEARRLAAHDPDEEDALELALAAERLTQLGCEYVLITGTHENTRVVTNTLYDGQGQVRADSWERLPGSYHGSGCTLASAIAGILASGSSIADAVREAQDYTYQTLKNAFRPGMGQFIPDRLYWARKEKSDD